MKQIAMYTPRRNFLWALIGYSLLIKILPFALQFGGLDIQVVESYPWSVTPVFAVGLFGVAMFRNLRLGFGVLLGVFLIADVCIGLLMGLRYGLEEGVAAAMYPGQAFNYLAIVLAGACGLIVRRHRSWVTVLGASLLAPILFFLASNFGVWYFDNVVGIGYARNLEGLGAAYVEGLPFFRNQFLSTLAFSALLFSPLGMRELVPARATSEQAAAEKQTAAAPTGS